MTTASEFVFERADEPWLVLIFAVLAVAAAWWAWRGYGPAAPGRAGLISRLFRAAGLVALVALVAGPAWKTTTTTIQPGRVLVAVDRSASMARRDGTLGAPRIAAASALARALGAVAAKRQLLVDYRAIGGVAGPIPSAELLPGPPAASGTGSPLADELDRLVTELRPDQLIVVSDGRVTAGAGLETLAAAWRGRDLQVAVLATGTEAVEPELLIDEAVINREVALGEREPVTVRLSCRALPDGPITVTAQVEGEPPATTEVTPAPGEAATMRPAEARLEVVLRHEGPATVRVKARQGELVREVEVAVTVRERKLKVLLLDYRPRYEVRYLREAFRRDQTVTLHAYLAEGKWRRWGEAGPADRLPLLSADLRDYDVVIIGDLGPDAFRESELNALEAAVRHGGTGLVWLPGETGALAGFARQKLGALIPVELPDAPTLARGYLAAEPHQLERTALAESLGLLDAGEVPWSKLPPLLGAATVGAVKPLAEVLVEDQAHAPIVVSRAYGNGRALFIAVDDTWRWRRNVGDRYLHRFHSQIMRFVATGRRLGNQEWRLFASPRRAISGEVVALNLGPAGAEPTTDSPAESVTVRLAGPAGAEQLVRLVRDGHGFSTKLTAPAPGTWNLGVTAGLDPRRIDADQLLVLPPAGELRDLRLDRPALAALARGTGGQVFGDPAKLVAALPDLRRSESLSVVTGWWDTAWALAVVVALFAVDWAIRRMHRLP